ncbi:Re/Si-specific NAD(P)(+) transhydrogenase subunit alpha [Gilvimarinus sp. DA14]|uniref:Re/Si-specific NAD(P)(+) transhydrogenase subunit alpha n=1 Tax=Gilvimarinus sp. DA14 TaxID=2956798 RepID=UPI0020B85D85|nr:Re/Si-specific NAD(P)(+) transhydrogenase subunit alpha [Gilvimarinus sp. DA14]UTF59484.1 Re/Si-specific NAD(P)(+) transhydrogenase subunit alpha [Gilvimarinus sp. DA14]
MKIVVPKERRAHERRVAATPDTVKKYVAMGFEVAVEAAAGLASQFPDDLYRAAGAHIEPDVAHLYSGAGIVLKVQRPLLAGEGELDELALIPRDALLLAVLSPYAATDSVPAYAEAGITAMALEFVPRITRAQSMDVLSSQSNLAGYRAVLDAAYEYDRAMPMMMTAAGTVAPAKVMVLGAGVAGLQAIATAKRLGAIVSATDVRPAAKEQVESLGGRFVMVESDEVKEAETAGGYAKEMSDDFKRQQAALVAETIKSQDIVICTALIPGRKAPVLVTDAMVASMGTGSIIIDLAVEQGGNCTASRPGEVVDVGGVKVVGHFNVPGRIAADASALYAKNLLNYLTPLVDAEAGASLQLDFEDQILAATTLTRNGQVVHPAFADNK